MTLDTDLWPLVEQVRAQFADPMVSRALDTLLYLVREQERDRTALVGEAVVLDADGDLGRVGVGG